MSLQACKGEGCTLRDDCQRWLAYTDETARDSLPIEPWEWLFRMWKKGRLFKRLTLENVGQQCEAKL